MKSRIVIRRGILLTLFLLCVSVLGACSNAQTIKPVPRAMKGEMAFPQVSVAKAATIKSATVTRKLRVRVEKALPEPTVVSVDMFLKISIQQWVGKDEALKGRTRAEALGVKMKIKALVKVIDPITKGVVAEYIVTADYAPKGADSLNDAEERCFEKFNQSMLRKLY